MSTRRQAIPRAMQQRVAETYGTRCWLQFPGCTQRADTMDHVMPFSKGGSDSLKNLRPACRHCNSLRADRLVMGRGIEVHVMMSAPRVSVQMADMAKGALYIDFNAMLGLLAAGRGVDDDVWQVAEAMWRGACGRALRLPSAVPVVLIPPADAAATMWREWMRLGYDVQVAEARPLKTLRCDSELKALTTWMRSGLNVASVSRARRARDDDWRRLGLLF